MKREQIKFEIIGDGQDVLVDGIMPRDLAEHLACHVDLYSANLLSVLPVPRNAKARASGCVRQRKQPVAHAPQQAPI